jgi:putative alpha-1,2-mannosidase
MHLKKILPSGLILSILISTGVHSAFAQRKKDYTSLVNPFIGTGGHGHTFPGATIPFGMVQLSPDTRLEGWDGCSGYHYSDTTVYGFSHTHLSGTGVGDYCDILFMPTVGEPKFKNTEYRSGFKKKIESASPGYYRTKLDKYDIDVELTATRRVGLHRYTYPSTHEANIIIDLQHRDQVLNSWIEVVNDHEIRGFRESKGWAQDQYVYFYAKFSKPFKTYGIALNDQLQEGKQKVEGKNVKMYIRFDNPKEVVAKVGISAVSAEGALKNLDAEVPDFDFKKIEKAAKTEWINALAKIEVEGGGPTAFQQREQQPMPSSAGMPYGYGYGYAQPRAKGPAPVNYAKQKQTIFYTSLYHTMMAPNVYSDVDGQYRGLDQKIHTAKGFDYYTVFSLWDTFRAEHPLMLLIDRKRTLDFIKTFLAMYDEGGLLPIWPLASNETYCMIGNHSIPVIVDAYAKGIRDFDAEKALKAMKAAVNRNQFGLDSYRKNGAVLADEEHESVSKTLEYAYDDWCIAQFAKMLGKENDYHEFIKRAQYWKNVFNPENSFMQGRVNGGWFTPFKPTDVNNNYTEGNSWQYSFLVPQDVEGLMARMGGTDKFEDKLNELFTTDAKLTGRQQDDITGLIGQYAHGNEPSHHMAYLFNFTNDPGKTQFFLSRIMNTLYSDKPDGLAGNEDCGQMSAWYVMSALGIYNIAPGQDQIQVGIPQFDKAVINLENGKKFTILNSGASVSRQNYYLQGMNLNKHPYNKLYINYSDIVNGGEFEIFTGRLPNKLFMEDLQKPTSKISDDLILPNPYFTNSAKSFKDAFTTEIKSAEDGAKIYYTLDGSTPTSGSTPYTQPIKVTNTTTIKAIAIKDGKTSFVIEGTFTKIRGDIKLVLNSKYLPSYAAQGDDALIDGLKGTTNWRLGNWQGYRGNDLEAIIDQGRVKPVKQVTLETLQDTQSWIVFPKSVEYLVSNDGKNFKAVATERSKVDARDVKVQIQDYTATLNTSARYIKVIARQYGPLPEWHESKGEQSYIFADEITVE